MRPAAGGAILARRQAATEPARVLATVISTRPLSARGDQHGDGLLPRGVEEGGDRGGDHARQAIRRRHHRRPETRGHFSSGGNVRFEHALEDGDAILDLQLALLQPAQHQFVAGRVFQESRDHFVEVAVFDTQFLQPRLQQFGRIRWLAWGYGMPAGRGLANAVCCSKKSALAGRRQGTFWLQSRHHERGHRHR